MEELFFGNETDIKQTWDDWTFNKLKTPRIFATERVEQLMPQFDLADEDIRELADSSRRVPRTQSGAAVSGESRHSCRSNRRGSAPDASI